MAEHWADVDGPLIRPLEHNGKRPDERRGMDLDAIDCVVRKYARALGLDRVGNLPADVFISSLTNLK
jgi:hypothetical protein